MPMLDTITASIVKMESTSSIIIVMILIGAAARTPPVNDKTPNVRTPKVAVIGAGIAGASTAYYLRNLFGGGGGGDDGEVSTSSKPSCDIDVYESAGRVGGRLSLVTVGGQDYEIGGTILHPRNHYMDKFVNVLGLEKKQASVDRGSIFNGKEYVFMKGDSTVVTVAKVVWRYGFKVLGLLWFVNAMLDDFSKIYDLQDKGESFETVDQLLAAMNPLFPNLTRTTARTYFRELGYSERFIDEMLTAATRVNYGQTADLNAFVGGVAVAPMETALWSVKGGNYKVPAALLDAAKANLIFSKVTTITRLPDNRFQVGSIKSGATAPESKIIYDMVFVCTPLTANKMSGISFGGFEPADQARLDNFDGQYQRTVATLVRGSLNTTTLRLKNASDVDDVLTTSDVDYFISIGLNLPVQLERSVLGATMPPARSADDVWKVFSPRLLSDDELDSLFAERRETHVTDWLAYPRYVVNESYPNHRYKYGEFILYPKLYYSNCLEWAGSAIEISIVAGRNVATLAFNHWFGVDTSSRHPRPKSEADSSRQEL